jgi:hypothetical protein
MTNSQKAEQKYLEELEVLKGRSNTALNALRSKEKTIVKEINLFTGQPQGNELLNLFDENQNIHEEAQKLLNKLNLEYQNAKEAQLKFQENREIIIKKYLEEYNKQGEISF